MEETLVHGDPEKQHGKMAQGTKRGPQLRPFFLSVYDESIFSPSSRYILSLSLSPANIRTHMHIHSV